jgi:arabinose-5-phosphate isomerase
LKQNKEALIDDAKNTFLSEIEALSLISTKIDKSFYESVINILNCSGKVIIVGIGKSAHIGRKIEATFNSTGTTSQFLHAAEAIHGDLGVIESDDIVIAISKSGNTPELKAILPLLKQRSKSLIAITGNINSALAKQADNVLDVTIKEEACPINIAPTTSTTAQLVMGDALAVSLMRLRDFTDKDFAMYHPGGALGKKLLWTVEDIVDASQKPRINENDSIKQVIVSLSSSKNGITTVFKDNTIIGVITDGDLRRMLNTDVDYKKLKAIDIMSNAPKTIQKTEQATKALIQLRNNEIGQLIVMDNEAYYGILDIHDLLSEGID